MRVLVTGGHGFVGSHLVEHLLARGDEVHCLYRRPGRPASLDGRPVRILPGDARDPAAVARAVAGVDEVYHLAALTRSRTRAEMFATNVAATRVLLEACVRSRMPGRFLLCSSLAAAGPSPDGHALTESEACRPVTWYGESKLAAEALVRRHAGDVATTIVRPPAVYGPRDRDFLAVFRAARRGVLPLLGEGLRVYHFIYAEDLAEAMVAAARHPAAVGATYYATHPDRVTNLAFLEHAAQAVGRKGRIVRVPTSALHLVAAGGEVAAQLTSGVPLLNRQRLRELAGRAYVCSSASLARDTGWRAATDLRAGMARTVDWYRAQGWLPR